MRKTIGHRIIQIIITLTSSLKLTLQKTIKADIPIQLFIDGVDSTDLYIKCSQSNLTCDITSSSINFIKEVKIVETESSRKKNKPIQGKEYPLNLKQTTKELQINSVNFNSKDSSDTTFILNTTNYNVEFSQSIVSAKNITINVPDFKSGFSRFEYETSTFQATNNLVFDDVSRVSHSNSYCDDQTNLKFFQGIFTSNFSDKACEFGFSIYDNLTYWVQTFIENDLQLQTVSQRK